MIGSVDAVIATIRAEADGEIERVRAHADQTAATLRELPPADEGAGNESQLDAARRRAEELSARMDWEERRRVLEQREAWIERVVARGNGILNARTDETRRNSLAALIRSAVESLRGGEIELRVSATDRTLIDDAWCRAIDERLTLGPAASIRGGCIVRCGAMLFDNSMDERAKRTEPVWRKALAGMYRV